MKYLSVLLAFVLALLLTAPTASAQSVVISGPSGAWQGETTTYNVTFYNSQGQAITAPSGGEFTWFASGGTVSNQTQTSVTIAWTTTGNHTLDYTWEDFGNFYYDQHPVTVTAVPVPAATFTYNYSCGSSEIVRTGTPPAGIEWVWTLSATSTQAFNLLGTSTSLTRTATTTLYLRPRTVSTPYTWGTAQSVGGLTVYTTAPSVPAAATDVTRFGAGDVTLSVSSSAGATGYKWYTQPSGGTAVHSGTETSRSVTLTSTQSYYVSALAGGCESASRRQVTGTVHLVGAISATINRVSMGVPVTLTGPVSYDTYTWKNQHGTTVGTQPSLETASAGTYTVTVTKSGIEGEGTSPEFVVYLGPAGQNLNYVVSNTMQVADITDVAQVPTLTSAQNAQTVQYFDGLGRPIQTVTTQASPLKRDIIQPIVYDAYGREAVKYLPYVAGQDGSYKASPVSTAGSYTGSPHHTFYTQTNTLIARDAKPYAVTVFEASPLNRVIKQGAPGDTWQPDGTNTYASTDHTIKRAYELNGANEVLLWSYTSPTTSYPLGLVNAGTGAAKVYYGAGQLMRNKTKDEQGHEVIEYTNKLGQVVLKRVQTGSSQTINDTNYAGTYYVYDNLGNLVTVIPPEATKLITQTSPASEYFDKTDAVKDAFLKRWAFRYAYDGRKRMTIKQVPGAEPVYMVYDKRDRLVMTQDGNQRTTKQWLFTKYDLLNRPVTTGLLKTDSALTQGKMQTRVNNYYNNLVTNGGAWGESYIGSGTGNVHGYNNLSYPKTDTVNNYLTVMYYDNYDFLTLFNNTAYNYQSGELSGQASTNFARVTGQVTGTKTKVLEGSNNSGATWLKAVSYFDDKYRVIQAIADNYKGGIDRITSRYDFVGKVLNTKSVHITQDVQWTVTTAALGTGNRLVGVPSPVGWGTSGAISVKKLAASTNGWMEFQTNVPAASNGHKVVGLSDLNSDNHYNTIDYAFYVREDKNLYVYENGVNKWSQAAGYTPGDVLKIERTGTTIKYYKNGALVYTSATATSAQLMVDAAFYGTQSEIYNVRASFSTETDSVMQRFEYDHAGRMLKAWQKIDNEAEILMTRNQYNELGELITKGLHSTDGNNFKQVVDHRYNIRGWLTRINNADVSNTTDGGPRDFFGMELAYENNLGIGTYDAQYNGNINAIKWSSNLGLADVKERGYTFSYDAMNRLTGAAHQQKNTSWASTTAFREDNLTYDLNGNIKTLQRSDASGALIDNLTYDYGTSTSNKLMKVTDSADDTKGFKEINHGSDDYVYDNNGNLVWDRNKGGVEVTQNSSFDNGSANWTVTDPNNRFTFTNGEVQVVAGAANSYFDQPVLERGKPYIVVIDAEITSGSYTISMSGTSVNSSSTSGINVVTATSGNSNALFRIILGTGFVGKIKSVSVKGVAVVTYNHLNLPATVSMPGDKTLTYYYDATGRKLSQVLATSSTVTKKTDYANEYIYENDTLQFINTAEGRYVANSGAVTGGEYQYHLKDVWNNTRLTFTTKHEADIAVATMETTEETEEQSEFLYYDEAVKVNSILFDHSNEGITYYSARLSGASSEQFGLAKSLKVMPGDTVRAEVYAKYLDSNSSNWTQALTDFMAAITSGTAPVGTVVDGGAAGSTGGATTPWLSLLNKSGETGTAPKSYLNYLIFDLDYNFLNGGFVRITEAAREYGQDGVHEKLQAEMPIAQAGYVYIYLSNDNVALGGEQIEVYFDDLNVTHSKSPIIGADDYTPFGVTFNNFSRENSLENKVKFQGQERIADIDLNWDAFKYRNYMPEIGRFFNIDPLAADYVYNSLYAFAENKLGRGIELEGAELFPFAFFSRPTAVPNALLRPGTAMSRNQHHLIPRALRNSRTVEQARKSDFKFEGRENKVEVEQYSKSTGEGRHGNHPNYNNEIQRRISEFERVTEGKATPEQAAEFLRNLIKEVRQTIENNPDIKINDLFQLNMTVESDATRVETNRRLTEKELEENRKKAEQQKKAEEKKKADEACANDPNCA